MQKDAGKNVRIARYISRYILDVEQDAFRINNKILNKALPYKKLIYN